MAQGRPCPAPPPFRLGAEARACGRARSRLRWRHLIHLSGTGPVVLLFNDGTAGLLTGANPEAKIVG